MFTLDIPAEVLYSSSAGFELRVIAVTSLVKAQEVGCYSRWKPSVDDMEKGNDRIED